MLQLDLLTTVGVNFSTVNWNDTNEIIRIEKRLKLELKVNPELQRTDVNNLIDFLRTNAAQLGILLQDEVLYSIATSVLPKITRWSKQNITTTEGDKQLFISIFEDNIAETLRGFIKSGSWKELIILGKNYSFLFNAQSHELLYTLIENKITTLTIYIKQGGNFKDNFSAEFATKDDFFKFLNFLNGRSFEKSIFGLLNVVSERYNHYYGVKHVMAQIMYAMGSFIPSDSANKKIFQGNKKIVGKQVGRERIHNWVKSSTALQSLIAVVLLLILGMLYTSLFYSDIKLFSITVVIQSLIVLVEYKFRFFLNIIEKKQKPFIKNTSWYIRTIIGILLVLQLVPILVAIALLQPFAFFIIIFFAVIVFVINKYSN